MFSLHVHNVTITGAAEALAKADRSCFRVRWMRLLGKILVLSLFVSCQWLTLFLVPSVTSRLHLCC